VQICGSFSVEATGTGLRGTIFNTIRPHCVQDLIHSAVLTAEEMAATAIATNAHEAKLGVVAGMPSNTIVSLPGRMGYPQRVRFELRDTPAWKMSELIYFVEENHGISDLASWHLGDIPRIVHRCTRMHTDAHGSEDWIGGPEFRL
jgi:hypothetical protein